MWKRILIFAVTVFLAGWFFFRAPYALYRDVENTTVRRVSVAQSDGTMADVTDEVDTAALTELIQNYGRARYKSQFMPYEAKEGDIEVALMGGDWDTCYVLISSDSDYSVLYTDAAKGGYHIKKSDELFERATALMPD